VYSAGIDLFALKFYLDRIVPQQPFLHQEARDTGLPDGEDRIPLRPLVLAQYRGVTDGRTDGFAVALPALGSALKIVAAATRTAVGLLVTHLTIDDSTVIFRQCAAK